MRKLIAFSLVNLLALPFFAETVRFPCFLKADGQLVAFGTDWRFDSARSVKITKVGYSDYPNHEWDLDMNKLTLWIQEEKIRLTYRGDLLPSRSLRNNDKSPDGQIIFEPFFIIQFEVKQRPAP